MSVWMYLLTHAFPLLIFHHNSREVFPKENIWSQRVMKITLKLSALLRHNGEQWLSGAAGGRSGELVIPWVWSFCVGRGAILETRVSGDGCTTVLRCFIPF